MSDQNIGKKELETEELHLFFEAYEWVTGEQLRIIRGGENPDFLCLRPSGQKIGIELTKIIRDPRDAFWERVINKKEELGEYDAQDLIFQKIQNKEEARRLRYRLAVSESILVLQLFDASIKSLSTSLDSLCDDFNDHGFAEIWLADYSKLDAYGDIELFALFPKKWWGYYQRPLPDRKPYG